MSNKSTLTIALLTALALASLFVASALRKLPTTTRPARLTCTTTMATSRVSSYLLLLRGLHLHGCAFVFFMSERNNVAPEYGTTMTISP